MRSRAIEAYKASLKLTHRQREAIVGLLLGDGHIEQSYCTPRARLFVEQRGGAREYVEWLYSIFQDWVRSGVKSREVFLEATRRKYVQYYFRTYAHEEFMPYRTLFYPRGKKIVPGNVGDILTPLGLAVWFMDDGSIKSHQSRGRIINTHSFTKAEVVQLCDVLHAKFKLDAWPRYQRDGTQIYISGKSADTLQQLLDPYVIPMMRYKLPLHSR